MASGNQRQSAAVLDYLAKHQDKPSRTIARLLAHDYPELFKSIDIARGCVRYYRGQNGEAARQRCNDKRFFRPAGDQRDWFIPESDEEEYIDYVIPYKSIGYISDVHIPYHNVVAVRAAFEWLLKRKIDCLLFNGDMLDFYMASKYGKDPRKRSIAGEIDVFNRFLDFVQDEFEGVKIVYKLGNHEERLQDYVFTQTPQLLGLPGLNIAELVYAKERGIDVISDQRKIMAGKLTILHGHELNITAQSVNPARSAFLRAKQSCLVGHSHVTSEHTETKLDGDIITCWSVGCLSELHPRYAKINKWNHGFAHIRVGDDGDYRVKNLRIHQGHVL